MATASQAWGFAVFLCFISAEIEYFEVLDFWPAKISNSDMSPFALGNHQSLFCDISRVNESMTWAYCHFSHEYEPLLSWYWFQPVYLILTKAIFVVEYSFSSSYIITHMQCIFTNGAVNNMRTQTGPCVEHNPAVSLQPERAHSFQMNWGEVV